MAKSKAKKKVDGNGQEILDKDLKKTSNLKKDIKDKGKEEVIEEKSEIDQLKDELQEQKDKYLRIYSEFDNFRRRTAKERIEMIKTANEDLIVSLLPVIDDFERAMKAAESPEKEATETEGTGLIYHKMVKVLEQKGVKAMNTEAGHDFDEDLHEAISQIPAPSDELKGKIVDVIERGYQIDEKVIRFAKVVTGA